MTADMAWRIDCMDALAWLAGLPDDYADLMVTSPPYEAQRTYGIGFKLRGQKWVDWMVQVVKAAAPKVSGLIAIVCEGDTRQFRYSATPFLLMADLHRAGFNLRKPAAYCRIGIPGSGGPDWLRNDWEPIICVTRPGKLPWSDNTACGHPPKWAPGGAMANRLTDGQRVNQWGHSLDSGATVVAADGTVRSKGKRPSHRNAHGVTNSTTRRRIGSGKREVQGRQLERGHEDGSAAVLPAIANPGNLIKCKVGGGLMGHPLAHENEAPFPLKLADFFVRSFCPPGGLVLDCFTGSGTTAHAAVESGRRFHGCDVRPSQVDLTTRRLQTVTPDMFTQPPEPTP